MFEVALALVTLASLVTTDLHADLRRDLPALNDTIKGVGATAPCPTCKATAAGAVETKMRACVNTLCHHDPDALARVYAKANARAAKPDPEYARTIQPKIDAYVRLNLRERIKRDRAILKYINQPAGTQTDEAIRMHNFLGGLNAFDQFKFYEGSSGEIRLDLAGSRPTFPELDDVRFGAYAQVADRVLQDLNAHSAFGTTNAVDARLIYGDAKLNQRISEVIEKILQRVDAMKKDPEFKLASTFIATNKASTREALSAPFAKGDITSEALANLQARLSMFKVAIDSVRDPVFRRALSTGSVDVKALAEKRHLRGMLTARIAKNEKSLKSNKPNSSPDCVLAYAASRQFLPNAAGRAVAESAIKSLLQNFANRAAGLVCAADQMHLKEAITGMEANLPATQDEFLAQLGRQLDRKVDSERLSVAAILPPGDQDMSALASLSTIKSVDAPVTEDVDDTCRAVSPDPAPDATAPGTNRFAVGPLVVRDPEKNRGVTYHELGHQFFNRFRFHEVKCDGAEEWFKSTRQCLRDNHVELTDDERATQLEAARDGGLTRFDKEDFADLISRAVDPRASNFACIWGDSDDDAGIEKLSLRANDGDSHSGDLFRALHLEFLRTGQIPDECRDALAERKQVAKFKNCLAPGPIAR